MEDGGKSVVHSSCMGNSILKGASVHVQRLIALIAGPFKSLNQSQGSELNLKGMEISWKRWGNNWNSRNALKTKLTRGQSALLCFLGDRLKAALALAFSCLSMAFDSLWDKKAVRYCYKVERLANLHRPLTNFNENWINILTWYEKEWRKEYENVVEESPRLLGSPNKERVHQTLPGPETEISFYQEILFDGRLDFQFNCMHCNHLQRWSFSS